MHLTSMASSSMSARGINIEFTWYLKVKEISQNLSSERFDQQPEKIIRSGPIFFGAVFLYLELITQERPRILVKCCKGFLSELRYVYATVKERAFIVEKFKKLDFLEYLEYSHLETEEIFAFHSMIFGQRTPSSEIPKPDYVRDRLQELSDARHGKLTYSLGDSFFNNDNREIPDFTVALAKALLTCEYVGTNINSLALEYLMKNLSAENVCSILKVDQLSDIKDKFFFAEEVDFDYAMYDSKFLANTSKIHEIA